MHPSKSQPSKPRDKRQPQLAFDPTPARGPARSFKRQFLNAFQKKAETYALSWVTPAFDIFATPISPVHKAKSERDPVYPVYFKANDIPKKD